MTSYRKRRKSAKPKDSPPRQVIYYGTEERQQLIHRAAERENESISQFFLKAALRRAEATQ